MIPHLLRYQEFEVCKYDFALDALNLGHPRLSINQVAEILCLKMCPPRLIFPKKT